MKFERIGNVIDILSGYPFDSSFFNEDGNGIPLIRVRDVNSGFAGVYYSGEYNNSFLIENKDLLVGLDGEFKCISWNNGRALLNQRVCKITPITNLLHRDYILHFLPNELRKIHSRTNYTTVKHLSVKTISEIKIPVFTLSDQIKISTVLNKAQELIKLRKESVELLDEFLKSIFLKMFGDPVTNEKDWESVPLSKLGTLDRGVSKHRPRNAPELLGGIYPLIQTGEVTNAGLYIRSYTQTYSEVGLKQSKLWKKGTMLITIAANIAQTSILTFDACFPDSIVGFIPDKKQSNNIYVHFLISFFQDILEKNAPQSAQKNLNLVLLRGLIVPKPPLELQNQFAGIVEKTEALKIQFQNSLADLEKLYASLSERAFKGDLDLTTVEIDETLLIADKKKESVVSIPPSLEKAIELSNKIYKQFESIDKITKVPPGLAKQIEHWNKLQDQFKNIPILPEVALQAQKKVARVQKIIGEIEKKTNPRELSSAHVRKQNWTSTSFTSIAKLIREHFWNKKANRSFYFNAEMLYNYLQETFGNTITYFTTKELLIKPSLQENETFKAFVENAINDDRFPIRFEQLFYNAEDQKFDLELTETDEALLGKEVPEMQSGIYFKIR